MSLKFEELADIVQAINILSKFGRYRPSTIAEDLVEQMYFKEEYVKDILDFYDAKDAEEGD